MARMTEDRFEEICDAHNLVTGGPVPKRVLYECLDEIEALREELERVTRGSNAAVEKWIADCNTYSAMLAAADALADAAKAAPFSAPLQQALAEYRRARGGK